jgi:glutamate-1-semialdehyde 2,1-aminomutase
LFEAHDLYYTIKRLGSMFCVFFTEEDVFDYESAQSCDSGQYAVYYRILLNCGIYLPPSQFEVSFISSAHDLKEIEFTLEAIGKALDMMK